MIFFHTFILRSINDYSLAKRYSVSLITGSVRKINGNNKRILELFTSVIDVPHGKFDMAGKKTHIKKNDLFMSLIHQFDDYYQVLPCLSLKTQSQEEKIKILHHLSSNLYLVKSEEME